MADFIAERSVISGTAFYTNFNTGHGVQYFKNGAVSKDEEWTNINIQDILPTWQWWITSTDDTKLTADFDYGTKYVCNDASGNAKHFRIHRSAHMTAAVRSYSTVSSPVLIRCTFIKRI